MNRYCAAYMKFIGDSCINYVILTKECIMSYTAKSNLTNLSFPSPGSRFALTEKEKRKRRMGGGE